jgi:hypothetical protein
VKDLTQKKHVQFSKELEAVQSAFQAAIEKLAEKARTEILPYFKKHGFDFVAGNGSWFISRPAADTAPYYRPDDYVEDEKLPKNIRDLLNLEVARGDHLGFYIRDIKRGEW